MKVRILIEQRYNGSRPERQPLASGQEYDLDAKWARELLDNGIAEPVAKKPSERAEKRPSGQKSESR